MSANTAGRRVDVTGMYDDWTGETDSLEPPKTLIVTGAPLMAFCKTLCTRAPEPKCNRLLSNSNCPRRSAIASPGPKTGQNSNGAGSIAELLR